MKRLAIIISLLILTTTSGFSPSYLTFTTGQVSPLMEARIEFAGYRSSARTVENMLVATQGPVFRRPGTKYIAAQRDSTAVGRLISYEHSVDDSYVLLFEDETIRFFRDGGQILDGVGTETLSGGDKPGTGSLVAHWLLNDISGDTVLDDNGGTHDGTASANTELFSVIGKVGTGAFDLDAQYDVTVADSPDFSFTNDSADSVFSIVCWAYITEAGDIQTILSKWRSAASSSEWRLSLDIDRKLQLHLFDNSTNLSGDRVAQWKMNDDAANTAVDDNVDVVPHDGVATSTTSTLSITGQIGKALDFDGTDSVQVSDHAALSFDDTADENMSISAWVNVDLTGSLQNILSKWDINDKREWRIRLAATGQLIFQIYDESANVSANRTSTTSIDEGWRFVTAVYDNADASWTGPTAGNFITLYIDGIQVDSFAVNNPNYGGMEDKTGEVSIGSDLSTGTPTNIWADAIDNVILFDIALTLANILSMYNSGEGTENLAGIEVFSVTDSPLDTGWRYLVCTYSAPADETTAAGGITFYVDSAAVASTATNDDGYKAMQAGAEEIRIGSQRNTGDSANEKFWGDRIDEISVFSKVLTSTEVSSLYSEIPYEIESPYSTSELPELHFIKSEDLMYLAHGNHEPRQLARVEHALWTLAAIQADDGPFMAENTDTSLTITPSGATGSITLTASEPLFNPQYVDSIWRIEQVRDTSQVSGTFTANGNSISTPFFSGAYGFTTSGNSGGTITLMRSTNNGSSWRPALTALTDTDFDNPTEIEEDGAIYRAVMSNYGSGSPTYTITITDNVNKGVVRITGFNSSTSMAAEVLTALVDTSATSNWREGYWSDYRGWPQTVSIHQQRLVFGGSDTFPQTIWFGKTDPDDYTNFTEGTLDTSAFTVVLAGNNPVQWMLSQDYLLIGNSGSCGKYGDQGKAVTPTSPNYQEQTREGAANLPGIIAGDAILYVERGSRKIREFVFDFQADKYLSPDLSVLSPEITESGIKDIAYQFRPYPILWCVLNNGDIATLTYQKNQSVAAWTKQITDGDFESVTVIPNTTEDEVWVSVKRTIDGVTETVVRYVEQFQPQDWGSDDNDAWFVDSGISYDPDPPVATNSFTGADHLDGETVSVYADLLIESPEVVSSGAFTIDNAATRVLVGLPFTSKLETMPIVIDPQDKAANKKIMSVWFDLYKTGYMEYGNGPDSTLINMNFNNNLDLDNTATAQDLITSRVKLKRGTWGYGTMMKQTVYVESDQPMPLTVRSITPSFNLFGN